MQIFAEIHQGSPTNKFLFEIVPITNKIAQHKKLETLLCWVMYRVNLHLRYYLTLTLALLCLKRQKYLRRFLGS